MNLFFSSQWLSAEVIQALCWTLIHSLWQGLIMAVIAGAILVVTRKSSARFRYNMLSGLFVLFVGGVCFTLIKQLRFAKHNIITDTFNLSPTILEARASSPGGAGDLALPDSFLGNIMAFFDRNAMLIVTIWFIILLIKCIRIVIGITYMQRLRYYKTHPVTAYWKEKVELLASRLQVKNKVEALESEIVKVPMVVGFLKPVILAPIGFFANLPHDQVEHILLHELAHIRRRDYIINILQSLTEVIFFFNPAVLWISTLIREDRENCCDDLALAGTDDKMNYVQALVSFQEFHLNMPAASAVGFAGSKYPVLNRIRRIVSNNNKKLNFMERTFLLFSIVIITGIMLLSRTTLQAQTVRQDIAISRVMTTDNNHKMTRLVEAQDNAGKKYKIVSVNKVITEFYIDGKQVPVETAFQYKDVIRKIDDQLAHQQELEAEQAKQRDAKAAADWNAAREEGLRVERQEGSQRTNREKEDNDGWNKAKAEGQRQDSIEKARKKLREEKDASDWQRAKEEGERAHQMEVDKRKNYEEMLDRIAADIVSEHIIASAGELSSFSLGKGEFFVNGQLQSYEKYNRFKNKYIKSTEEFYRYNLEPKKQTIDY